MAHIAAPPYSVNEPEPPAYPTALPPSFPIGRKSTQPLVIVEELQAHLRILAAFDSLRQRVKSAVPDGSDQTTDDAWFVFLARAVHRFHLWVANVVQVGDGILSEDTFPPLDVFMVWHSYSLNPRSYYEDCLRLYPSLLALNRGSFPIIPLASLISPETHLPHPPSPSRKTFWESRTSQLEHFDCPLSTTDESSDTVEVKCPSCEGEKFTNVRWVEPDGTGYAQRDFKAVCEYCKREFDRDAMCIRKFCEDAVRQRENPDSFFLAGTLLHGATGTPQEPLAKALNNKTLLLINKSKPYKTLTPASLTQTFTSAPNLKPSDLIAAVYRGILPRRIIRVINCYTPDPSPASLELTGAILRQGGFIDKVKELGWLDGGAREEVLVRSVARYHAFLDLMTSGITFFVPTIDIDLSWHTHQLKSAAYRANTIEYIGRTPDHDDKVEESALATGYDITAKAWKERFGVPYSVCGCAPLSTNLSTKLVKFFKPSSLSKSLSNTRPDLVSTDETDADATHPSEHNSVVLIEHKASLGVRKEREKGVQKRMKEAERMREKGKLDAWESMGEKRRERNGHEAAFMTPVAYWGIAPMYGFYGYGASCAAYGGGIIGAGGAGAACATGGSGGGCAAGGCSGGGGGCGGGGAGGCGGGGGGCGGGGGGCGGGGS